MATNGMTINGLNPLSALTADDKIPVWDTGASGEPTKEITGQNLANSVKSLAKLPNTTEMNNAIAQSTAKTETRTAISGSTGNFSMAMSIANVTVISVVEKSGLLVLVPFGSGGNWFCKVMNADMSIAANQSVNYEVTYLTK